MARSPVLRARAARKLALDLSEGFGDGPRREFIPVYAYNLLRNLNTGPVLLRSLFGSDDEGAVFFLSHEPRDARGRYLMITEGGRWLAP